MEYLVIIIVIIVVVIFEKERNKKSKRHAQELRNLSRSGKKDNEFLTDRQRQNQQYIENQKKALISNTYKNSNQGEKDYFDDVMFGNYQSRKISARIAFDYIDANGNETQRTLKVRSYDRNAGNFGAIDGFCEFRKANRGFRFERMSNIYDADTGEIIPSLQVYLDGLYEAEQARIAEEKRLAQEAHEKTPEYTAEYALSQYKDFLQSVYYVARADGACRKPEKDIILKHLKTLLAGKTQSELTFELLDKMLKKDINDCSGATFKSKVRMIIKDNVDIFETLRTCCLEIVGADKTIHPIEQDALNYLETQAKNLTKTTDKEELKQHV